MPNAAQRNRSARDWRRCPPEGLQCVFDDSVMQSGQFGPGGARLYVNFEARLCSLIVLPRCQLKQPAADPQARARRSLASMKNPARLQDVMPANVSDNERAIVIAGFANEVEAVNQ